MPAAQRDALLKKMARTLRRQMGLREDDQSDGTSNTFSNNNNNNAPPDMFSQGSANADWYFNNPSLKSKGYNDFKQKWGNRPNVDNWQISSIMKNNIQASGGLKNNPEMLGPNAAAKGANPSGIDYKSLLANLPLTPAKMKISMDSVEKALFLLGKTYQEGIADYRIAIDTY